MNRILFIAALAAITANSACNSGQPAQERTVTATQDHKNDSVASEAKDPAVLAPAFKGVDPGATQYIGLLVADYLQLKDALADGNSSAAGRSAAAMAAAMKKADKSLFTPEQRKVYEAGEDKLEGYAQKIAEKDIAVDLQRQQFAGMSEALYPLVKSFGGGRTLYHDHCPMYGDNGAMWISAAKEIRNPYMGEEMRSCGEIMEIIK